MQWFPLSNLSPNIYMSARKSCLLYRSRHNYEKSWKFFKFTTCHWILGIYGFYIVFSQKLNSKVNQLIPRIANSPARSVSPPSKQDRFQSWLFCPNSAFLLSLPSFFAYLDKGKDNTSLTSVEEIEKSRLQTYLTSDISKTEVC